MVSGCRQRPPQGLLIDAQQAGDTGTSLRTAGEQDAGLSQLLRRELAWSADMAPTPLGRRHTGLGPFGDQRPLEFREGAQHVKDQPAAGRGGVDGLGQ